MRARENAFWFTSAFLLALLMFIVGRASAAVVPPCEEDEHVTAAFTCVNDDQADYLSGYWYERGK